MGRILTIFWTKKTLESALSAPALKLQGKNVLAIRRWNKACANMYLLYSVVFFVYVCPSVKLYNGALTKNKYVSNKYIQYVHIWP